MRGAQQPPRSSARRAAAVQLRLQRRYGTHSFRSGRVQLSLGGREPSEGSVRMASGRTRVELEAKAKDLAFYAV